MSEKEETREIRLMDNLESGTYGVGVVHVTVEAGKTVTVPRDDARALVNGGNFEYVGEASAPTKESLMKLTKDELISLATTEFAKSAGENAEMFDFKSVTKDKLSDYILTPASRDVIISPPTEDREITSAAGGASVSAAQIAGVPQTTMNSTTTTTTGDN